MIASGSNGGFPRTRGDGPPQESTGTIVDGFPPHARGWTVRSVADAQIANVSPARAGMDPAHLTPAPFSGGFPRTRGDGPLVRDRARRELPFPPHARGWTPAPKVVNPRHTVSPARAGMDPS